VLIAPAWAQNTEMRLRV